MANVSRLTSHERVRDSSSIVPLPSSFNSLSPFLRETRIKRRADQIVGPILVSPHLFSASIEFVCPLWVATVETDDGITIEGSRMILEVFRGGEGEVVEFRLTLDDR